MKFNRVIVAPLVLLAMSGCASIDYNYEPERTFFSEPPLEQRTKVAVGEPMIRQGKSVLHDAIYLPKDVKLNAYYTLRAGYYTKDGESEAGTFYSPSRYREAGKIERAWLADESKAVFVPKSENSKVCVITIIDYKSCGTARVEYTSQATSSEQNFQQYLVYGGGYGLKVNVIYRELVAGYARPAFDHSVEYDLTKSMEIGYRGARIKVIRANNEWIEYSVISYFSPDFTVSERCC